MKQQLITDPAQILTVLSHHESQGGARPLSLRLACPVKTLAFLRNVTPKTKCPWVDVVKHSHVSGMLAVDYSANVNAQRTREGREADFEARANWFEHVTKAIVTHKKTGELYAFVRVLRNLSAPIYTCEGGTVERATLAPVLPADDLTDEERAFYGLAPKVANVDTVQGTDKAVLVITVKLANVRELTVDGVRYTSADVEPLAPITVATPTPSTVNA